MQIRELYLKNFGKFSEQTFLIKDGMHVFYGENEFGKSTIYAFIKGMLFGMERARGRASKNDMFSQYEPWNQPNYYAGVLRFSVGDRNFRLERSFDKITKSASLICEDDGEELSIEQGDLDVLLEGMNANTFENTIAIGQLRVETSQDLAVELKNYAANFYETGNSEIDLQNAMNILKLKKKNVDAQMKHQVLKKEHERSRIQQECDYVRRDMEKFQQEEMETRRALHKLKKGETRRNRADEETTDRYRTEEDTQQYASQSEDATAKRRGWVLPLIGIILLILAAAPAYFVGKPWGYIGSGVILALDIIILMVGFVRGRRIARDISEIEDELEENDLGDEDSDLRGAGRKVNERDTAHQAEHLRWQLSRVRANLREKQVLYGNLNERLEELEEPDDIMAADNKKSQALRLASDTIMELSAEIVKGFGRTLNEKTSEIISAITEGKYTKVYIDENLDMFLLTREKRVAISQVSRGTIEQVYFALRMAAVEILYEDDFPVILDDTFVFYDEKRLESVLKWLYEQKKQVILFTCQKREMEILDKLEMNYSVN